MYALQPQSQMSFDHSATSNTRYRSLSSSAPSSPTTSIHSNAQNPNVANSSNIGRPIYFLTGPHTGKTIRMELVEIQKADLGRKYAKVDRRPLDPPPVILLKIYEIQTSPHGEQIETEMAYELSEKLYVQIYTPTRLTLLVRSSETQLLGLLCTVDLFPVPAPDVSPLQRSGSAKATSAPVTQTSFFPSQSPASSSSGYNGPEIFQYRYKKESSMASPTRPISGYIYPPEGMSDIVHHLDGFPITENSKQTQALVGATFVQPAIIDYQGSKAIVFVFSDLAVKIEGTYLLRYRVFDIFGKRHDQELGITAETYGGTFRVYSTKEFPGLSASTELTKLLARWGVRLNIRETERRRRKRPASDGRRSPTPECDD